jgi:hypothetical protein
MTRARSDREKGKVWSGNPLPKPAKAWFPSVIGSVSVDPNAHMSPQHIQQLAPTGFFDHSKLILSRIRSTVHDTAKDDEELNLYLGELLLVCFLSLTCSTVTPIKQPILRIVLSRASSKKYHYTTFSQSSLIFDAVF